MRRKSSENSKERIIRMEQILYGNGSKGIAQKLEDNGKKIDEVAKKYNKLNQKITIMIVVLVLTLGEGLGALRFLGKLFNL